MRSPIGNRVESIDLLKGLVMVVMALDHVRDYFHAAAFLFDPTDPTQTTWPIYLTRWITHYCAPAFSFLAGLSAFFVGRRKEKKELSAFLLKRGVWLVFIEMTIVNFAWYFDPGFHTAGFLVIWSLGMSMIVLAALIHLSQKSILIFSLALIFGHNLLDVIHFDGSYLWAMLHNVTAFRYSNNYKLYAEFPIIPWAAVMALGYSIGSLYDPSFDRTRRKTIFSVIGVSTVGLFLVVRGINVYGDPKSWITYETVGQTTMSFLNPTKYPPSLSYLLMTLGPAFLFLAYADQWRGKVVDFFCTFGRVPFFYYILHLFMIHFLAMLAAQVSGFGWEKMILEDWVTYAPVLKGYGFSLWVVYGVWLSVIVLSYPLCQKFDRYKLNHKDKWWLSYL